MGEMASKDGKQVWQDKESSREPKNGGHREMSSILHHRRDNASSLTKALEM